MQNVTDLSQRLMDALALEQSPVAVIFSDDLPTGSTVPDTRVAAGCAFWEIGAQRAVATTANEHQFCSIGIHTHNLANAPDSQNAELASTLAAMQGLDYVRAEEVEALPVMQQSHNYVCYSPLAEASETPDVVMIFANAAQGLIITEAVARVDGQIPATLGRPACAVVPQVVNYGSSASLGCCGARAYLKTLDDGKTIWALKGNQLKAYVEQIETLAKANNVLTQFHEMRMGDIANGQSPTVEQSLGRLG